MSTAFRDPIVLWREPVAAVLQRIVGRFLLFAVLFTFSGVPGVVRGLIPWTWLSFIVWLLALIALLQAVLAVANWRLKRRVLLVLQPSGSLEWPQSYQERWFQRPIDAVSGRVVRVTEVQPRRPVIPASPRVTLNDSDRMIRHLPLHGATLMEFISHVNELTEPHGVKVTFPVREEGSEGGEGGVDGLAPAAD